MCGIVGFVNNKENKEKKDDSVIIDIKKIYKLGEG